MNAAFDASKDQAYTTVYYGGSVMMMPYNLGAVNTANIGAADKPYNDGLFYQWGRKDPFLGGANYTNNDKPISGTDYYNDAADFTVARDGSVDKAYKNPTTFYKDTDYWSEKDYANLWGNGEGDYAVWETNYDNSKFGTKTLFDPCPPGYMVAPWHTWSDQEFGILTYPYDGTNSSFYSASGCLLYHSGGLDDVGRNGFYWSSSPYCIIAFYTPGVSRSGYEYQTNGYSVRCARIE
jgi:hypothetical protein